MKVIGEEDRIIFEFSDDGIGIEPDLKERIFEKFYKGSGSRGCTGSGLSHSQALVEKQNEVFVRYPKKQRYCL